jgi:hypothetical protein
MQDTAILEGAWTEDEVGTEGGEGDIPQSP